MLSFLLKTENRIFWFSLCKNLKSELVFTNMTAYYDVVSTHSGSLSYPGPWMIKETLSFRLQLDSALCLLAAHCRSSCIQQAPCSSPVWPPLAVSQQSFFFGSEVPTHLCLLLVTCSINQHLCSSQSVFEHDPASRFFTFLAQMRLNLRKSAFTCPAISFCLYLWSDPFLAGLSLKWLLQTNWRPANTLNFSSYLGAVWGPPSESIWSGNTRFKFAFSGTFPISLF